MGTRHLVAVFKDGHYHVAQYGQWDGYPEGCGLMILRLLHRLQEEKRELELQAALYRCHFADTEELADLDEEFHAQMKRLDAACQAASPSENAKTCSESYAAKGSLTHMSRDTSYQILDVLLARTGEEDEEAAL